MPHAGGHKGGCLSTHDTAQSKVPLWRDVGHTVGFVRLRDWQYWRRLVLFFCIFSVVGHLVEFPYCWIGMTYFGSVDPDNEVITNPLKPFFIYGVGIVLCSVFLEPFRRFLLGRAPSAVRALIAFYLVSIFIAMAFELIQGFTQNQPVNGEYPLWDVHDLPGNILGQAWIVNDLLLGALITFVVWLVLPFSNRLADRLEPRTANILCAVVVTLTLILTVVTYA